VTHNTRASNGQVFIYKRNTGGAGTAELQWNVITNADVNSKTVIDDNINRGAMLYGSSVAWMGYETTQDLYLIVGAPGATFQSSTGAGTVFLYRAVGDNTQPQQDTTWRNSRIIITPESSVGVTDASSNAAFGTDVSGIINAQAGYVITGAPDNLLGRFYIYRASAVLVGGVLDLLSQWSLLQFVNPQSGSPYENNKIAKMGRAVALAKSATQLIAVVSSPDYQPTAGSNDFAGRLYYLLQGTACETCTSACQTDCQFTLYQGTQYNALAANAANGRFGTSIAVSPRRQDDQNTDPDGNIVVGAPNAQTNKGTFVIID